MSTKAKYTGGSMNFFDTRYNNNLPSKMWADCPWLAAMADPSIAHYFVEDFQHVYGPGTTDATMAGYTRTQATAGTVEIVTNVPGGAMLCSAASATQHQGVNVQKTHPIIKPAAGKHIWFEVRAKRGGTASSKSQLFIGLSKINTTILPSGIITAQEDFAGVASITAQDNRIDLVGAKGATRAYTNSVMTLDDEWHTYGLKFNGITSASLWIDGVDTGKTIATANVPAVDLTPSWVCQSDGTTGNPTLTVDYWGYLQLR